MSFEVVNGVRREMGVLDGNFCVVVILCCEGGRGSSQITLGFLVKFGLDSCCYRLLNWNFNVFLRYSCLIIQPYLPGDASSTRTGESRWALPRISSKIRCVILQSVSKCQGDEQRWIGRLCQFWSKIGCHSSVERSVKAGQILNLRWNNYNMMKIWINRFSRPISWCDLSHRFF